MSKSARLDFDRHVDQVAADMRVSACTGVFDGHMRGPSMVYIARCRHVDSATASTLIFTRDEGHHSSGWLRNPDYERCWHLSISAAPARLIVSAAQKADSVARAWVKAFFGDDARLAWFEGPKSRQGVALGVTHWRVFADEAWIPILPRGEVYTKEFTELGWRSASQVLEEDGRLILSSVDPT